MAQVSISADGSAPDSSAMLEVKSEQRGFLMPRMSTAQREAIAGPANGLLVYDSTSNSFWVYKEKQGWTELDAANQFAALTKSQSFSEQNMQTHAWEKIANVVFPMGWRDGPTATVYKDTILVLGGWDGSTYNQIYASANGGLAWSLYGTIPNRGHAMTVIRSTDGFYYLIGNDQLSSPGARKSVYRTKDFRTWELRTANAEWGDRMQSAAVEHNGALYVMGGQSGFTAGSGLGDVWKSTNGGTSWEKVADNLSFMGKNVYGQVVSFEGRLWLVSGGKYDNNPSARTFDKEVYSSEDGHRWKREKDIPINGKTYANVVVWDGKIWLINGSFNSYNTNEVAYMDKSGNWHVFNVESSAMTPTHASAIVVWRDQLLRIAGNLTNDVWRLSRKEGVTIRKANTGQWEALAFKSAFADKDRKIISWNNSSTNNRMGQIDVRYNANSGHASLVIGSLLRTNAPNTEDRLTLTGNGETFLNGRLAIGATYFSGAEALKVRGHILVDGGSQLSVHSGILNMQRGSSVRYYNMVNGNFSYIANTSNTGTNLTFVDNGKEAMKLENGRTTVNNNLQVNGTTSFNGAVEANVSLATDADYTVSATDYMVIFPEATQPRNIVLPAPPATKVRILVFRNNNTSDTNWQFSVPVKGDGEEISSLPNGKTITLYGTNGVWYAK